MNIKTPIIGIVGKPNVGKSTFFKSVTMQDVEIANYPFTTINPNEGIGYVKILDIGEEFGLKSNPRYGYIKGKYRFVPIKVLDIPGLVPGAHEGKGLGNKFLDSLRQADGLIHVIDISGSTDEEGKWIGPGNYDPIKDVKWLEEELDWWFFQILKRNLEKVIRIIKLEKKDLIKEISNILSGLNIKYTDVLNSFKKLNIDKEDYSILDSDEILFKLASEIRKESKKIIIAANRVDINIDIAKENIKKLKKEYPDKIIIPTSGYAELILKELDKNRKIEYIPGENYINIIGDLNEKEKKAIEFIENYIFKEFGSTGVQNSINVLIFDVLNYISVFPVGEGFKDKEGRIFPDCFLLPKGSNVLNLAEAIHSDFAKKFVKAIDMKNKKIVGKDYILNDRDVIQLIIS